MKEILRHFKIEGTVSDIAPLGDGLINDTYRVTTAETDRPDYVLQRINTNVFTNPEALGRNISIVTSHLRKKLEARGATDIDRRVLRFIETDEGRNWWQSPADGNCWRVSVFISDAVTLDAVDTHSSREAGQAFGDYELMLSDLPADALAETIPQFHNMELRLSQLQQAIRADVAGRAAATADFIADIMQQADAMCLGERLHREGRLPRRICHCDTKVNNMMFDRHSGRFLLVIDLDTTMPSLFFSDYGDFLRSAANATAEDDPRLENVRFRDDIFRAFTEGYIQSASQFLTPPEIHLLPYAAELFPYMQAVRFLWDYLCGDHYWKCRYEEHNLDRARNQWRLFLQVKAHERMMSDYITTLLQPTTRHLST